MAASAYAQNDATSNDAAVIVNKQVLYHRRLRRPD
jgi:hypothetical protein